MRTNVRYNSKYISNFKNVIMQHINLNLKDYLILSIIFVIGVMFGVVVINNSNEQSKNEISGYINSFIETIKEEKYEVGIPLIYIITSYKGFCIGYTISAIIASLGPWKRNAIFPSIIIFAKYYCNTNNFNVKCKCFKIIQNIN